MAEYKEKSTRGELDLSGTSDVEARRAFLKGCAKYAVAMPPAVTLLLSANPVSSGHGPAHNLCSNICDPGKADPPNCDCIILDGEAQGSSAGEMSPEEQESLEIQ